MSTQSSDPLLIEDLESATENSRLRELILGEIRASGPITFARFMELALYHPIEGYYCSPRRQIGPGGDYLTSPEISPLFGSAIARQLAEFWRRLGTPAEFSLIEVGAGNGTLARDMLRWIAARDANFYAALRYRIIELSPTLRARQRELLGGWQETGKLSVHERIDELGSDPITGCILANELIDSFPVHRVCNEDGRLREILVGEDHGQFVETTGKLSAPALAEYFERLDLLPGEGCVAEVNLAAIDWIRTAARTLARGFLLLLDYGYEAERLYAPWRRSGTLLCFHRHEASENPYLRLGRQDMTTHVDFTTLTRTAEASGLRRLAFTDQRHLLADLGVGEAVRLDSSRDLAVEEFYHRRRTVAELLDPSGLGRIGVLLLGNEVRRDTFTGFGGAVTE